MGHHRNKLARQGFSLLELVIIVAVLTLLSGIVAPVAKDLIWDAKAQKIADLADVLRGVCTRYHMDTDNYAKEGVFAAPDADGAYPVLLADRNNYLLSFPGGVPKWNGPYIDHPLTPGDNPTGYPVLVSSTLFDAGVMAGFDLDGSGVKRTGPGNMLIVQFDPREDDIAMDLAQRVDEIIDGSDGDANRLTKNRVVFSKVTAKLYIYLYQAP